MMRPAMRTAVVGASKLVAWWFVFAGPLACGQILGVDDFRRVPDRGDGSIDVRTADGIDADGNVGDAPLHDGVVPDPSQGSDATVVADAADVDGATRDDARSPDTTIVDDAQRPGADADDGWSPSGADETATDADGSPTEVGDSDSGACVVPRGGVALRGHTRFLYGADIPFVSRGVDFGGRTSDGSLGVAGGAIYASALSNLGRAGAKVVRWTVFSTLNGDGVTFSNGLPQGLSGTTVADVEAALDYAERLDLHLVFTIFSLETFRPQAPPGPTVHDLLPVLKGENRSTIVSNIVRPLAQAVNQSPNKHRLVAWDLLDEPELLVQGQRGFGTEHTVTADEMRDFLSAMTATLRSEGDRAIPVTLGSISFAWATSWSGLDLDFYSFQPYTDADLTQVVDVGAGPGAFRLGKPIVLFGVPFDRFGSPATSFDSFAQAAYDAGWAGVLGLHYQWDQADGNAALAGFAARMPTQCGW